MQVQDIISVIVYHLQIQEQTVIMQWALCKIVNGGFSGEDNTTGMSDR